ncbi:MAG: DUF87 domain-containing protein [Magnetospirillum sp. WYHS-4]
MAEGMGRIVAVTGATVLARAGVDESSALALRIGGLVRIAQPDAVVFGVVNSLALENGDGAGIRLEIQLLGEVEAGKSAFRRGVSFFPRIGDVVEAAPDTDIATIYAPTKAASVRIGTIHQTRGVPAHVLTDELLGKHFAILGSTGSGKSCTVALLLQTILEFHPGGHVILLDPHNEYAHAFKEKAEAVSIANLHLPYWLLNFEELVKVLATGEGADRESQIMILKEAVLEARKAGGEAAGGPEVVLTVDTPVPFRLSDLKRQIDGAMGKLEKPEGARPYMKILNRLDSLMADRRFAFMFSNLLVRDVMADLLSRLLRIPVAGKPVTCVDLSGVPSEIVDVVVSVLTRMIFDFAIWSSEEVEMAPVLLVCEEAHRYAPENDGSGFGPTRASIARIAKEGRKYGVSICLVSQRPSELSATILSQCSTLFALRLANEQDLAFVRNVLPESAGGFLKVLPALHPQEALAMGEGVPVPMRIRFDSLPEDRRPKSHSAAYSAAWREDRLDGEFVRRVVQKWRRQVR